MVSIVVIFILKNDFLISIADIIYSLSFITIVQISSVCGRKSIILFTSYITDCKHPPLPLNGNVTLNLTTFGENATYTCNNGYNISGNTIRTCDNKGNWSGLLPNCTLVGMFHVIKEFIVVFPSTIV
jgi:hypothetical protein